CKIAQGVVGELGAHRWRDGERAWIAGEERITVGRALHDELRARDAAGAGPVFDDDVLSERCSKLLPHPARLDVGRTRRWKRHDDAHSPGGVGLGRRMLRHCQERNAAGAGERAFHEASPPLVVNELTISSSTRGAALVIAEKRMSLPRRRKGRGEKKNQGSS